MNITTDAPSLLKCDNKDKHLNGQLFRLHEYLFNHTASRFMAAIDTGIPIQNICRYCRVLSKSNSIAVAKLDRCRVSGQWVEMLTTNPENFPPKIQLTLWD